MRIKTNLALLAACIGTLHGAAMAQSNVTIYGLLDAAIEYSNQGEGALFRMQSGGYNGSRIGFRGTEDLGNGLSALFTVETGFGLDTGNLLQGGRVFGRQAFVGLRNQLGTLTLGRQYSPYYLSLVHQDAFLWTMAGGLPVITRTTVGAGGAPGNSLLLGVYQSLGRVDNSIVYATPTIGGFSGMAMYALGEVGGNSSAGRVYGANIRYVNGPVSLTAGHTGGKDAFDRGSSRAVNVGGNVKFGPAVIYAGYVRETNTTAANATAARANSRVDLLNLGARYSLTQNLTLVGQVIGIKDRSPGLAVDRDSEVYALGAEYALSKRTLVYTSAGTVDNQNGSNYSLGSGTALGAPVVGDARAKTVNVGVRHTF